MNARTFKANLETPADGGTRDPNAAGLRRAGDLSHMRKRVFVVEDHPLMRRSIIDAIERESDLAVCGQAEEAFEAIAAIGSLQPDIVLTDLQLKSSSGLELIKTLHSATPALPIIATTMFDVNRSARLARAAGAASFVAKQDGPEELIAAIRALLKARADADENV